MSTTTIIQDHEKYGGRTIRVVNVRSDGLVLVGSYRPDRHGGPVDQGIGVLLDDEGILALIEALLGGKHG